MSKDILWRLGLTAAVIAGALWSALPLDKKINLGLDLQGGMHLIYEVDTQKAVLSSLDALGEDLKKFLESKGVITISARRDGEQVVAQFKNAADAEKARGIIEDDYTILSLAGDEAAEGRLTYEYDAAYRAEVARNAIGQALETLRNRVDQFGVAEPTIASEGENRILIQLPGVQDRQRAIDLIGRTARLEFRMLNEEMTAEMALERGVPSGSEVLYQKITDPVTKQVTGKQPYLIRTKVELTGGMLANARVSMSNLNQPYVSIDFNKEGGRIFARLTEENVGRRMAIVMDNNVYSAPKIRERIPGGSAMIEGSFTFEEANDLAIVLRAGSLPAPLIKLEERSVGPSLGRDSIESGVRAALLGGVAVALFMLVYYRLGGVIANLALTLNIVIIAGAMGYFGATLTLPGIAGIILTLGMAVDANVLIYERIREELRNGKTVRAAVEAGFGRAFLTIVDSNVTTLIAALVLFQFGTGPVKGFAVTLSVGLISSMFTAVFVSRTLFDWYLGKRRLTELKI